MLRFYGVPRRISPGFAHSAAAARFWRRRSVPSVDLKESICSEGRKEAVRSVDLKQHVCVDQSRVGDDGRKSEILIISNRKPQF